MPAQRLLLVFGGRSSEHEISLRTDTFAVACERILTAREERGLYP